MEKPMPGRKESIVEIARRHTPGEICSAVWYQHLLGGEAVCELEVAFPPAPYGVQCNLAVGYWIEFWIELIYFWHSQYGAVWDEADADLSVILWIPGSNIFIIRNVAVDINEIVFVYAQNLCRPQLEFQSLLKVKWQAEGKQS